MHHCHSSKLIQRGADTRHVCRVDWYDPICLSHMQLSHPHPFRTIRSSGAFSSLNASSISCAVRLIPSKPQSPPPCTILTKFRLPVNQAAFCPTARIFPKCCRGRHSHLRANSRNQPEFRIILLQPEKYFFFFRADTVQKNGLYLKIHG